MSAPDAEDGQISGFRTTFAGMFGESVGGAPSIERVAVPIIQRDYAQGRQDVRTSAIRASFLDALEGALLGDTTVGLDFIYGEVEGGRFEPLDGQQRLTTLFLLHWYVAVRRGAVNEDEPWTRFTYATRPSARLFCERIVKNPPPADLADPPSKWLADQSWYLHLWRFDPTISAMLVTLDAIAERFVDHDADLLWNRLTDAAEPAIWFQLLPIEEMGAAEDLYIKMNSRGKPLTEFEAFKAYFGQLVEDVGGFDDFGHKIDGDWTDVFWPYRGDNDIVDDEFMRYFDFLMEVCEWREGRVRDEVTTPEKRALALVGSSNERREEHLAFICSAFETWVGEPSIADYFGTLFRTSARGDGVRLFGANTSGDLFHACCERYGDTRGSTRLFSLTDTLLLFAVLVHRLEATDEAAARLRVLRNMNEASQFELRVTNMPKFIHEVEAFVRTGDLEALGTFNSNQRTEEASKRALLEAMPDVAPHLHGLEDHSILRGTLAAFELDSTIAVRAGAFERAFVPEHWPLVTGALLASGEYQRSYPNSDQHRFGSPTTDSVWRLMLVDRGDRDSLAAVRGALGMMLDKVAMSGDDVASTLVSIATEFTTSRAASGTFDWRYHLVRYAEMREGNTGIYYGADGSLGYEMTMLRKKVQRSYYRDPYLYAMWSEARRPDEVTDPWFYGYSTTPRWMELVRSKVGLRSVAAGIAIRPSETTDAGTLSVICNEVGAASTDDGWLLAIPQSATGGIDTIDRVQVGADLLARMIEAGL